MMIGSSVKYWKKIAISTLAVACVGFSVLSFSNLTASAEFGQEIDMEEMSTPLNNGYYWALGGSTFNITYYTQNVNNTPIQRFYESAYTLPNQYAYSDIYGGFTLNFNYMRMYSNLGQGYLEYVVQPRNPNTGDESFINACFITNAVSQVVDFDYYVESLANTSILLQRESTATYGFEAWSWTEERWVLAYTNTINSRFEYDSISLTVDTENLRRTDIFREINDRRYALVRNFACWVDNEYVTGTGQIQLRYYTENMPTYSQVAGSTSHFTAYPIYGSDDTYGLFGFVDDFFNIEVLPNFKLSFLLVLGLGGLTIGFFIKILLGG